MHHPVPLSVYPSLSAASAHITEKVKGNTSTRTIKQIASRSGGRERESERQRGGTECNIKQKARQRNINVNKVKMLGPLVYTIQETSRKEGMQKKKEKEKKQNPKRKQQKFCAAPETGSSSHVGSARARLSVCLSRICLPG